MKNVDVRALMLLKLHSKHLNNQQYKTLRGQVLAGDAVGALRGLKKILRKEGASESRHIQHR